MSHEKQLDDQQRLLAIREHLRVRSRPGEEAFDRDVVEACLKQVQPIIDANPRQSGEVIIERIATHLGVKFEEVQSMEDIQHLERKYLHGQKELGFAMLAQELADPSVDALLFQRLHASNDARDRWIAVINLQATQARGYWSRPHELLHRLAEPPQKRLKFYRHRTDLENRIERLMDLGAAELAFPRSIFGVLVSQSSGDELTWDLVRRVRGQFARTASLLSAAKAFVRFWPRPAFLLKAEVRGRKSNPTDGVALRITLEGFSDSTSTTGLRFFPNMRVPESSPIMNAHLCEGEITDFENLGVWTTSRGSALQDRRVLTSAAGYSRVTYGLITPI